MSKENQSPTLFDWLGLSDPRGYPKGFWHFIGFFLTLVLMAFAALFVMAFAAAFVLVFGAFTGQGATLGLGALLVALLGAPFLIWRTVVAQNTLDTARKEAALKEEALFNDKINAAAKDLAARRQVTRVVTQDDKETILTEWEDDLVTRAAAIDRLEGLARDAINRGDPSPAQRIARMLSIYVQELSKTSPPTPTASDAEITLWLTEQECKETDYTAGLSRVEIFSNDSNPASLRKWAQGLKINVRNDIERAVQSLGRINPNDAVIRKVFNSENIDLRKCNLQGFDLSRLNFEGALFDEACMQGAIFNEANLNGASFFNSHLEGAYFFKTKLNGARLNKAKLRAAYCVDAELFGVALSFANLQETNFTNAKILGADLLTPMLGPDTNFTGAILRGSACLCPDETLREAWNELIVFAETMPEDAPRHWVQIVDKDMALPLHDQWRAWAATLTPPVTIAPDYRDQDPV